MPFPAKMFLPPAKGDIFCGPESDTCIYLFYTSSNWRVAWNTRGNGGKVKMQFFGAR